MIVVEVLGVVVLAALLLGVTEMAVLGLMGMVGMTMTRCRKCGHLHPSWSPPGGRVCAYCRHPGLSRLMPLRVHHLFPGELEGSSKRG